MQPFHKYIPSSKKPARTGRPVRTGLAKNSPRPSSSGKGTQNTQDKRADNKDLIAKAIKHASEKSDHFRSKATERDFKTGKLSGKQTNYPQKVSGKTLQKTGSQQRGPQKSTASQKGKSTFNDTRKSASKSRGGGKPQFKSDEPRLHTYKNKPRLKTGSDKDNLVGNERVKVIVLGGNEEVGRNMTLIEYKDDIIIIDMGLQFPEEDMPGVDYIIPNTSYLNSKLKNIRGAIITHGHYDHIGAIPHLQKKLGNPPLFMNPLTAGIVKKRQDDFKGFPKLNITIIRSDDVLQLGVFKVEFFRVSHNIPDSFGVVIHTPAGIIVHTGDFKIDPNPSGDLPTEIEKIKALGKKNVLALMADSTNAPKEGHQLTEGDIQHNIDDIIGNAKGRVIIGTFASMLGRIYQIVQACERMGRKVAVEGFSMKSNVKIAQALGYMKVGKNTIIDVKDALKLPDNQVVIICTGAQGEDRAVLMRIANGEHQKVHIQEGDTVVFSSSVIPGNERSVQRLKDTLYREGAEVVHYQMMDVHAGGHACQEDLKNVHDWIKPKYLIPIEGNHSFLRMHAKAAVENGFPAENIFIADNGQIIEFDKKRNGQLTNKKVPTEYVFVDGLGVGDTNHIVLRDRVELSQDGVAIVMAVVSAQTGKLLRLPDIITRGFVYIRQHEELIPYARRKVAEVLKDEDSRSSANGQYLKDKVREQLGQLLFDKTGRRPMILTLVIEV
ncbi:MAG: ribonuclease J [Patescibacteria group bacterium]|nr:ribonuclease J [Patescibacteria group bacterium]